MSDSVRFVHGVRLHFDVPEDSNEDLRGGIGVDGIGVGGVGGTGVGGVSVGVFGCFAALLGFIAPSEVAPPTNCLNESPDTSYL